MELQFTNDTNKNKTSIVFNEDGLTSDILYLDKEEVAELIKQTKLAIYNEDDTVSIFNSMEDTTKSRFGYVKQKNSMFLLSISVTENFAIGKYLKHSDMKRIISQLSRV